MADVQYDAIIIGGGHNGLVTAGYLAKEGLSVLVLERQDVIGGACITEELYPGFRVPYCAYICYLLQGRVIDDLKLRDYGLDIIPLEYENFHPYPDGTYIQPEGRYEHQSMAQQLAKFSEHDARMYPEWASFFDRASDLMYRYWMKEPPTIAQVFEDVRGTRNEQVWDTMLTVSMRDMLDEYFESEHVKANFVQAMDTGDPSAPGSILSTSYYDCSRFSKRENVGIPRGSMGSITQAMARSAEARGVELRVGSLVDKVLVDNGVAKGVRMASGDEIYSRIVVSDADPKRTYLSLVEEKDLSEDFISKVKNLTTRANCVKFLAALSELPDFSRYLGADFDPRRIIATHICPTVDYYKQSWDACKTDIPSSHPIMDVQIPSIADPALAPSGHHVLSAWCLYYPADPKTGSWDDLGKQVGEQIIDVLTEYAPNFRKSIVDWTAQTPKDIEIREGMTDGNIRHIDITAGQIFAGRMPYRAPIDNMYLCGAGTHPGGEVTAAPGHNAAKAIIKDLKRAAEAQPVG